MWLSRRRWLDAFDRIPAALRRRIPLGSARDPASALHALAGELEAQAAAARFVDQTAGAFPEVGGRGISSVAAAEVTVLAVELRRLIGGATATGPARRSRSTAPICRAPPRRSPITVERCSGRWAIVCSPSSAASTALCARWPRPPTSSVDRAAAPRRARSRLRTPRSRWASRGAAASTIGGGRSRPRSDRRSSASNGSSTTRSRAKSCSRAAPTRRSRRPSPAPARRRSGERAPWAHRRSMRSPPMPPRALR